MIKAGKWQSVGLLLGAALLGLWAFSQLPIEGLAQAFDWKKFWAVTHAFQINYNLEPVYNPPWVLALLWPVTAWPLAFSYALACLLTSAILVISVPTAGKRAAWAAWVLALLFSYPALRHMLDGNLEGLMIAGALLLVWALSQESDWGLAMAVLLLTTKLQESWLLLAVLAFYLWRQWPRRQLVRSIGWTAAITLPLLLWRGGAWWRAATDVTFTWTNSSLLNVLGSCGLPAGLLWSLWAAVLLLTLWVYWRQPAAVTRRVGLGALLAGGLLLSPYASTLSVLTPLAVGLVPELQRRGRTGALVFSLFFLPYALFLSTAFRLQWENAYWTGCLVLTWALLLAQVHRADSYAPA